MFEIDIEQVRKQLQNVCDEAKNANTEIKRLHEDLQKYLSENRWLENERQRLSNEKNDLMAKYESNNDYLTRLTKTIGDLQEKNSNLENKNKELKAHLVQSSIMLDKAEYLKVEIENLKSENEFLKQKNQRQKKDDTKIKYDVINEPVLFPTKSEEIPKSTKRDYTNDPVIAMFNQWAASPKSLLPSNFKYLEGEFKIRSIQTVKASHNPSRWITNKNQGTKYLFPNPNTFDQMTDISDLYQMDTIQLQSKGNNKIRIEIPCEISETGFVEYPGKLQIL